MRRTREDGFSPFAAYCAERLREDPHLRATVLFGEVAERGYTGGYSTFTRALNRRRLRPLCTCCTAGSRAPAGRRHELRWDWLSFAAPPADWGFGAEAHVLAAVCTDSGHWRAALVEQPDLPYVAEGVHLVLHGLGTAGTHWRITPPPDGGGTSERLRRSLAPVARHYGAVVDRGTAGEAPPGHGLRAVADSWWLLASRVAELSAAQHSLDRLASCMDGLHPQPRAAADHPGGHRWVQPQPVLNSPPPEPPSPPQTPPQPQPQPQPQAAAQRAIVPSAPFPALVCEVRTVDEQSLIAFRGNRYAVPYGLTGAVVHVRWRIDQRHLSITTRSGAVIARHILAPRDAGLVVPCTPTGAPTPAAVRLPPARPGSSPKRAQRTAPARLPAAHGSPDAPSRRGAGSGRTGPN